MAARVAYDAVVVGSGPNGLAAAITIAQAGRSVVVYEAAETIGGGMRSAEVAAPGFLSDICSAVHPLAVSSPFFSSLPLKRFGLEWIYPEISLAHPMEDGPALLLEHAVGATARRLGPDKDAWINLFSPLARDWRYLAGAILGPLRPWAFAPHPVAAARFGLGAIRSASGFAQSRFRGVAARALFGGLAAHGMLDLGRSPSAAYGLILATTGHAIGWPIARGGSRSLAEALAGYLRSLGGEIITGARIDSLDQLPPARAILCDVTPRQLLRMAGNRLSGTTRAGLNRYRYGPGAFKIDYALDGPVPWLDPNILRASVVHVGGTLGEITVAEHMVAQGEVPERPFVLVAQQSLFDDARAPAGRQTLWVYCHIPHGSHVDMTERIEAQIERFAPGFRDRIIARHIMGTEALEQYNPNYIGGDINGGLQDWGQLFTRPLPRINPYAIGSRLYLCSAPTPPGGGVHGMSGYWAARAALAGPLRGESWPAERTVNAEEPRRAANTTRRSEESATDATEGNDEG